MRTTTLVCSLLGFLSAVAAQADAPQPVIINTEVKFFLEVREGTFTATAPLCASGTTRNLREVANPSVGHGYTVDWEFTCDDNSGSFHLQYHPQAGKLYARDPEPEFTVAGPWQVVEGGTGRYAKLTGHGDFGVVVAFDENGAPLTGEETFVGFVQLD